MIVQYDPKKLQEKLHGPYPIVEIRMNGTVSLQRRPGISKSYNIRKLRSYNTGVRKGQKPIFVKKAAREEQKMKEYSPLF